MRKRFFAFLLALAVMLTLLAVPVFADSERSGTCGEDLTWSLSDDGALTIRGTGAMSDYQDGSPWAESEPAVKSVTIEPGCTAIGVAAFAGCLELEQVSIPDTVTSIRGTAFLYCMSLQSVQLPDGLTEIEDLTFYYCSSLPAVSIPSGVTRIGADAFASCESLTSVSIPDTVTCLGEEAFAKCCSLTSVTLPGSVAEMGENAFFECTALETVTFMEGIPAIGDWAFVDCSSLRSVEFPSSLTSVGASAFLNCSSLSEVRFGDGVAQIGDWAFSRCGFQDLVIPDNVSEIGSAAFQECKQLENVQLPAGLAVIHNQTFNDCYSLASVTIPDSVTGIGDSAFAGCSRLADVYYAAPKAYWDEIDISSTNSPLLKAALHTTLEITRQPKDYLGALNSTASFKVVAAGEGLTYQWQISDDNGATWSKSSVKNPGYTSRLTADKDGRLVRCIVTDPYGHAVASDSAAMGISVLKITAQPKDFVGALNATAKFTVAAEGSGLTYQWQISDDGGATWTNSSVKTASYSTKLTADRIGRMVRCIVKDAGGGTVTSDAASMKLDRLVITTQPKDYVGDVNSYASFRVEAAGEGITYQWQVSDDGGATWSNSSVKNAVYTTRLTADRNGRMVRCIVKSADGSSVTSEAAAMWCNQLTITGQPKNYMGKIDSTAKFKVTAEGAGLKYQWQVSDDNGATWTNSSVKTASYSTKLTVDRDGRLVRCIVSDATGSSVISNSARMTIG